MTLTSMMIIISGVAICMATIALSMACLAYAKIIGMEKSTHKIEWMPIAPNAVNDNIGDGNEIQDLPTILKKKGPKTLHEQMAEFAYPDIEKEMV